MSRSSASALRRYVYREPLRLLLGSAVPPPAWRSTEEAARSAPAEPVGCIYCTWRRTSHISRHSRGWSRRLRAKQAGGAQRRYGEKGGQRAPHVNVNDASEYAILI